jgi:hypothetical protein
LAIEIKSLLVGESADPMIEAQVREMAEADPYVQEILQLFTVQQGPGEIIVVMKVRFTSGLTTGGELCNVINAFEDRLRAARPEARWCFIEPDVAP